MPGALKTRGAPPILDFSAFYGNATAKQQLVEQIRDCCEHNGFFQITGHPIPPQLQQDVMQWAKRFFALPEEEKLKLSKDQYWWNRGYERLRSQSFEPGQSPDLKESFFVAADLPKEHALHQQKKVNCGPNVWPENMPDRAEFERCCMEYYNALMDLSKEILKALALTLDLDENFFQEFATCDHVGVMRMIHYPPQDPDSDEKISRGIGAHTDFGALTLLLQDEVDGLQVWDKDTDEWHDVTPVKGAYVVNLGNFMMRWSNDRYKSNLHRVINKSGKERYSIPCFFGGNADYVCACLPNCRKEGEEPKYPPITVTQAVSEAYNKSFGAAKKDEKTEAAPTVTAKEVTVA